MGLLNLVIFNFEWMVVKNIEIIFKILMDISLIVDIGFMIGNLVRRKCVVGENRMVE